MEFGKSFTYVFEDEDWIKKILIAAVIALIPMVGPFAIAGWGVEITRRVIKREPETLPDWSDFVNYLIKGVVLVVIVFVYMLPVILMQACSNGVFFFGQDSGEDTIMMIGNILMACFGCLTFIYAILAGFLISAAAGKYADTGEIGAAFRFGEIFATVRAAPVAYLMVLLGGFLAGLIAMLGTIACVIGVFFTTVYAGAINAHLQGQAYNEATSMLATGGEEL